MEKNSLILAGIYLAINLMAFITMWVDKIKSRKNSTERISEGMLFFMATILGSAGVYTGMFFFRHKNRKWYFIVGIPFLLVQNIVFILMVYNFVKSLE